MTMIYPGVYQFSLLIPHMLFTIHQYLLLSEEPVLISTGTAGQTERILPEIKKFLNGKELAYVLVAHMESDECGGLSIFQREYPKMITVCSELCARELRGFGYAGIIAARGRGEVLSGKGFSLKFIDCPSEVHLQDGLVFYEETRRIFFSADLMLRFGDAAGKTIKSSWKDEVNSIGEERVPNAVKLQALQNSLRGLSPDFIAVGHGFCIDCRPEQG